MHESEKWKWSRSVVSDASQPHGLQPTRLLRPWDFPGKSTGVGCHCPLRTVYEGSLFSTSLPTLVIFCLLDITTLTGMRWYFIVIPIRTPRKVSDVEHLSTGQLVISKYIFFGKKSVHLLCCCCCVTSVMSNSVRPQRWQPTRLRRPWDSPGKNTGVGCHFLLQCVKVKSESEVALLATPWTAAYQAPPSMGFSRQEYWSGVPLPSLYF